MKYTFSDEEEESDALGVRRSRRGSGRGTPAAPAGPTVTASGRQVKSRATGAYGESLLSGQQGDAPSPASGEYARSNASEEPYATRGRATRANGKEANGRRPGRAHIETYNSVDEMDDDEATSWDGGDEDEEEPEPMELEDDAEDSAPDTSEDEEPKSLVVHLKYAKGTKPAPSHSAPAQNGATPGGQVVFGSSLEQATVTQKPPQPVAEPAPQASMPSTPQPAITDSVTAAGQSEQPAALTENTTSVPSHLKSDTHPAPTPPYAAPSNPETNGHYQASHSPFQASLAPPTPASS